MKRSAQIRLLFLGGLSAGAALTACAPERNREPRITPDSVYTNDYFIAGAGYYHAPFRAFFRLPYNHYDAQRKQYFHGGRWSAAPHRSIVNISAPTPEAAAAAEAVRGQVSRGGFGRSSRSHYIHS